MNSLFNVDNARFTEFLFHLLELNNMVTLLHTRKQILLREPNGENREWHSKVAWELKALNDQTNLYVDEYADLLRMLENSTLEPVFFILDSSTCSVERTFILRQITRYLRQCPAGYDAVRKVFPFSALEGSLNEGA